MLKEAMQFIANSAAPNYLEAYGQTYTDTNMAIIKPPSINQIQTQTLGSIVDYIKNKIDFDGYFTPSKMIIHIVNATKVVLADELGACGDRDVRMSTNALLPKLYLDSFIDLEQFNIMMQSGFVDTEDRAKVLSIVCNITDQQVTEHQDDGVTQQVNIKAGIARIGAATVPNPVLLAPYRTFTEVEQPKSGFILRLRPGDERPKVGLFEADGGAWEREAIHGIKKFYETELAEEITAGQVVILA